MNTRLPAKYPAGERSPLNHSRSDDSWLSPGASASSVIMIETSRIDDMFAQKNVSQTAWPRQRCDNSRKRARAPAPRCCSSCHTGSSSERAMLQRRSVSPESKPGSRKSCGNASNTSRTRHSSPKTERLKTNSSTRSNSGFSHHRTSSVYSGHGHITSTMTMPASQ